MTKEEEMALRELAAKPHYISKVSDVLGPLSLWSKDAFEAEIRKAVEAEREACAERAWKALINKGADWSVRQLVSDAITQKGET